MKQIVKERNERHVGISGTTIKMIAVITMIIDHIGAVLIDPGLLICPILRTVGRVSFPLFCFLIVEGFLHTRDVKRYAGRLLLFAFLSEIPFDLAFRGTLLEFEGQNVYFTLFIGLLVLIGLVRYEYSALRQIFLLVAGCAAAIWLHTDYDAIGVVLIAIFYLFRFDHKQRTLWAGLLTIIDSFRFLGAAALALIPIGCYNGERGKYRMKYFFYWFYPVHLLILYWIARFA